MNFRHILAALVLSLFTMGAVQAAGQPIHEDFTELLGLSDKMLEAGKAKDSAAFVDLATQASGVTKDQGNKGNSPRLQRVSTAFKKAKKAAKANNFDEANKVIDEAIVEMKKPDVKPTFGGTTEGGGRDGLFGKY
jgi:hypothetical protein